MSSTRPPAEQDQAVRDELTLTETAELLGVHYMTAYRYVRIGKLPARREGTNWRVERRHAETLRDGGVIDSSGEGAGGVEVDDTVDGEAGRGAVPRDRMLVDRLLAFDERGAWQVVESALASGFDTIRVHTEIVGPAMREVGERWAAGRLPIAREHGASAICRSVVGRLSLTSSRPGRSKGTVLFVCAPGDDHRLPLTMAADVFRASGFDVVDCGAELPIDSFVDLVASTDRLVAVGIGATVPGNRAAIRRLTTAIRERRPEITILIGGGAVGDLGDPAGLGADHIVTSALDGVAVVVGDDRPNAGG